MSKRGIAKKTRDEHTITLERAMVTRHYIMQWDLDKCVGCQMGPTVCPKEALTHIDGEIMDGRLVRKPSVDVDPEKCVNCGMCVVVCPTHAITMKVNNVEEIPVIKYEAFPELLAKTIFHKEQFDFSLKDYVIDNCSANVISYDDVRETMRVDFKNCIHCRQCEVASDGAFTVQQAWQGSVTLKTEKCVPGCLACADICPTRALHINDNGELILADYFCIKCGACMFVCPIQPEFETIPYTFESQGLTLSREYQKFNQRNRITHQGRTMAS